MIDRPKFKEIAYTTSKMKRVGKEDYTLIIPEMKDKGRVEDVYDTVELKMDGIWGVFKCNLKGDWTISSRTGKIKKEGHTVRKGCWGTTVIGEFMHGSHWAHQRKWDGRFYAYDMLYSQEFGDMSDWRDLVVELGILPRQAELELPLELVVVVSVVGDVEHFAGSSDRTLEAAGLGDNVVRQNSAVRPPAHAQAVRVRPALLDGVVDAGHDVLEVRIAPVCPQVGGKVLSVARRAARVRTHDHISLRCEQL